jgi:hypothetical protein
MRAVSQRKVRLVVTRHRLLASQHEAWQGSILADMIGKHLVDGNAGSNDRFSLNVRARQKASCLRGMNALTGS